MNLRDCLPTHLGPFPIKGLRHRVEDNVYIVTIAGFAGPEDRVYPPAQFASLIQYKVDQEVLDRILGPKLERVITLGEIVARRLWRVDHLRLRSMTTDSSWPTFGVPIRGDNPAVLKTRGIHAYKLDHPLNEIIDYWSVVFRKRVVAIGTVYLFGDVIEFDNAYRAHYASVRTIDKVYTFQDSRTERTRKIKIEKQLRELYCDPENIKREKTWRS